jgi:hypothetical protein
MTITAHPAAAMDGGIPVPLASFADSPAASELQSYLLAG